MNEQECVLCYTCVDSHCGVNMHSIHMSKAIKTFKTGRELEFATFIIVQVQYYY